MSGFPARADDFLTDLPHGTRLSFGEDLDFLPSRGCEVAFGDYTQNDIACFIYSEDKHRNSLLGTDLLNIIEIKTDFNMTGLRKFGNPLARVIKFTLNAELTNKNYTMYCGSFERDLYAREVKVSEIEAAISNSSILYP